MATVYYCDDYTSGVWEDSGGGTITRPFVMKANFPAAGFVLNDIITLCPLPGGFYLTDFQVSVPSLDTGSTVTLDMGDSGGATPNSTNAAIFFSAVAGAQNVQTYLTNLGMLVNATWTAMATSSSAPPMPRYYSFRAPQSLINLIIRIHVAPGTATTSGVFAGWARGQMAGNVAPSGYALT